MKKRGRGKAEDTVPNFDDPSWTRVTSELMAKLVVPMTVEWIKEWVRDNKTTSCNYLNMLAYLSIKGLVTSCYNRQRQTYWVVIANVPDGWSTSQVKGDAYVRTSGKKFRDFDDENHNDDDISMTEPSIS